MPTPEPVTANCNAVPWWGRLGLLWLMFPPVCVTVFALCMPISPNDFWYHVRAGSVTATTGHIPTTNLFSTGVALDKPYFNQGWLAHWSFYETLRHGGLAWMALLRAACMGLAYALVTWAAMRRARRVAQQFLAGNETEAQLLDVDNGSARVAAAAGMLTFAMSALNMDVRPQTFSFPLFALFTLAVYESPFIVRRSWLWTAGLAVAMVFWVNLHGAFFTGLLVLWAVLITNIACRQFFRHGGRLGILPQLAVACLLASLVNQKGWGIFSYVASLANNVIGEQFIQEWKRPEFHLAEWSSIVFFLMPVVLVALAIHGRRKNQPWPVQPGEAIALLVLFVMGLRNVRALVWFALFAAPFFAALLTQWRLRGAVWWQNCPPVPPRPVWLVNAFMALVMAGMIVPVLPWFKPALPWPLEYRSRFAPTPQGAFPLGFSSDPSLLIESGTPVEAAEFLRASPPRGRLYNEMVFGSYLMWALYPRTLPHADPRIELYPDDFWFDYVKFNNTPLDAGRKLAAQGFTDVLANPKLQQPLVDELSRTSGWEKRVFKSGPAVLFRVRN